MTAHCSRLAPSPTGALHLGNARTFLWNWALARTQGWRLIMRMEDLDGPRIRTGAAEEALDILKWLELDWDGETRFQASDLSPYEAAMASLAQRGLVYPCSLSRREVAASAPHERDQESPFGPELRPARAGEPHRFEPREGEHWRLLVSPETLTIVDELRGSQHLSPAADCGDFVVWTVRNEPAYQLAVVVDDARQGVTDVVRGDDLLPSAARQELLYRHLGHSKPRWWHLPLVRGQDGRRLAKRHGDSRVRTYREAGVSSDRILGLLAAWCGFIPEPRPITTTEILDRFTIRSLPGHDIVMTAEDDRWLRSERSIT